MGKKLLVDLGLAGWNAMVENWESGTVWYWSGRVYGYRLGGDQGGGFARSRGLWYNAGREPQVNSDLAGWNEPGGDASG